VPVGLIRDLELDSLARTEGILADGSTVTLETYFCFVEWFGTKVALQVVANDGRFSLLGTKCFWTAYFTLITDRNSFPWNWRWDNTG
jgi:hypothetical protein